MPAHDGAGVGGAYVGRREHAVRGRCDRLNDVRLEGRVVPHQLLQLRAEGRDAAPRARHRAAVEIEHGGDELAEHARRAHGVQAGRVQADRRERHGQCAQRLRNGRAIARSTLGD